MTRIFYWANKDGKDAQCEEVGPVLRCGHCGRGNVGWVKGGLHRAYCLVCGAILRKSVVHTVDFPRGKVSR